MCNQVVRAVRRVTVPEEGAEWPVAWEQRGTLRTGTNRLPRTLCMNHRP